MSKGIVIQNYSNMILPIYKSYFEEYNTRINIFYGGAGSGKSKFVVQKLMYKLIVLPKRKCLVTRKVGATIRDSIFQEFKSLIGDLGVYNQCNINKTDMTIELPNGSQFIFKGLDDSEKIKSISDISDIVIEEATELIFEDFIQLNLRMRSNQPYQQIHMMFNPTSKNNWTYTTFFEKKYYGALIVKSTYRDNPHLDKEYIKEIEQLKETNYPWWEIYANGKFASLDKRVFTNWQPLDFNINEVRIERIKSKLDDIQGKVINFNMLYQAENPLFQKEFRERRVYFGLDFGYTNDPTAFVAFVADKRTKEIWIFDEFYLTGLTNEDIYKQIQYKGYSKEIIIADSAEPKSIEELRRLGLRRVKAAAKGKDSIMNGIQKLQSYKIYIHPKCVNTITEFENYTWQKDRATGNYINKPIDNYCHIIDALRYGAEELSGKNKVKVRDKIKLGIR